MSNDYDNTALVKRVTLKAFTAQSGSLSSQEVLDLCNDSLRSYLVPMSKTLRDEWWVGKSDIIVTTDTDGAVTIPDSVASTIRTISWLNAGYLCPLTRIEPENSFQYLSQTGQLPVGFMMRGYTLIVLPKAPNIALHITAMLRPPQMVLTAEAAEVATPTGATLVLESVPLAWQSAAPTEVDVISGASPFSPIGTFDVSSLAVATKTLVLTTAPSISGEAWVSDVGTSPFANIPIELFPFLEADVRVELFTALGDKRLPAAEKRRDSLEKMAKETMAPRTQGNGKPILNGNGPGVRGWGAWGRTR